MKKRLILIAGNIGVGKTTTARKIAERIQGQHVDVDDFKKGVVDPGRVACEIDDEPTRRQYYLAALEHIVGLFEECDYVVMDEIFHVRKLREEIEEYCHSRGIEVVWINVRVTNFAIVEQRLRAKTREGHLLTTDEALLLYRIFESQWQPFDQGKRNVHVVYNDSANSYSHVDTAVKFIV